MLGQVARRVFSRCARVTACSDDLRTRAIALGARPADIETLPYGVDSGRFAPSAEARARVRHDLGIGDRPLVVSAGRLVKKKGFDVLIEAADRLKASWPDIVVAIAGDGDLRDDLARQAAPGGVVRLLGNQSQDQIAALCAAADAVAVPSVHDEAGNVDGLPNFALEALASATPVVATRVGGLPQAITDGETGILVAERDASGLAQALHLLLSDPIRRAAIGRTARAEVEGRFGWSRVAERLEAAYGPPDARSHLS